MVKDNEKARALEQEMAAMGDDQRIIVFANTKSQVRSVNCLALKANHRNAVAA